MEQLHARLDPLNLEHFFVLEGGGPITIGYEVGVLDELRERGADLSNAHFLGTLAGSWAGGMVLTGKSRDDIMGKPQIKLFNYDDEEYIHGYAKETFGDARDPRLNVTGTHFPSFRTHVLNCGEGESGITIADGVTRSSSVPFLFKPTKGKDSEGNLWVDGAVGGVSAGYAHWAPHAETLVCVSALSMHLKAPLPGKLQHIVGAGLEAKTKSELWRWGRHNPESEFIFIRPNERIGSMITPRTIFDFRASEAVYDEARGQIADLLDNEQEAPKLIRLRDQLVRLLGNLTQDAA